MKLTRAEIVGIAVSLLLILATILYNTDPLAIRLARCLPYSVDVINDYFVQAGVVPWWFVDGMPVA